jgi:hypothetical protein
MMKMWASLPAIVVDLNATDWECYNCVEETMDIRYRSPIYWALPNVLKLHFRHNPAGYARQTRSSASQCSYAITTSRVTYLGARNPPTALTE